MAKFMKVHDDEDEEWLVNLEQITVIDEDGKFIGLPDGEGIEIGRQCDWEKIMSFVNQNEV